MAMDKRVATGSTNTKRPKGFGPGAKINPYKVGSANWKAFQAGFNADRQGQKGRISSFVNANKAGAKKGMSFLPAGTAAERKENAKLYKSSTANTKNSKDAYSNGVFRHYMAETAKTNKSSKAAYNRNKKKK